MRPLGRGFFARPTVDLARALLGKRLECGGLEGRIVETEAYLYRDDPACHAGRGRTARNEPMFGPAGNIYVYLIYGMYHCMNIVSGKTGEGEAVLIRALEPIRGIELMRERRGTAKLENLCNGPGKLTRAFGITKEHNNLSLLGGGELRLLDDGERPEIQASGRIGLSVGGELQLRFFVKGNRFVSCHRRVLKPNPTLHRSPAPEIVLEKFHEAQTFGSKKPGRI
ncbi:MAG: DNA-3-methyladenine glycosylase [Treponema sp.]|nr:DNA-3-methyladenine glycosylase [Treponema sp.]